MSKYYAFSLFLSVIPHITWGATKPPTDLKSLVDIVINLVSTLTTVVFVLTVFAIIWGVIKGWIIQGAEEEGIENGKKVAFVGIIVLVLVTALWGILALLKGSLFG